MYTTDTDFNELKNVNYELFLVAITLLSVANIFLLMFAPTFAMRQVVWIVDLFFCVFFLGDFVYRLLTATSKTRYLVRQYGWLDLLGSLPIPFIRVVRLVRSGRTARMLQKYGLDNVESELGQDRASSTLLSVAFLGILVLELGSYFVLCAEGRKLHGNVHSPSDALWWSIVTIATVGYGDKYPVTNEGRVIGVLVIITGVGLFGAFTGCLANTFINRRKRRRRFGFQPMPMPADPLEEIRQLLEQQALRLASIESRLPPAPPTDSASTEDPPT
jgi:voltage-gated potassium channel